MDNPQSHDKITYKPPEIFELKAGDKLPLDDEFLNKFNKEYLMDDNKKTFETDRPTTEKKTDPTQPDIKSGEFPFPSHIPTKKAIGDALWNASTEHPFATLGLISAGLCTITYKICVAAIAAGVRKGNMKTIRDLYRIRR